MNKRKTVANKENAGNVDGNMTVKPSSGPPSTAPSAMQQKGAVKTAMVKPT